MMTHLHCRIQRHKRTIGTDMLRYRDFVPKEITASGFLKPGQYESFDAAVAAANEWLESSRVRLLKIETVVLPNIHSRWEEGSTDAAIHTSGDSPSQWHQFLRCWYQEPDAGSSAPTS